MKVLFVGFGLPDYVVAFLNKLDAEPNLQVVSVVDSGKGHVAAGTHQTKKGVQFKLIELEEKIANNYTDHSYRTFVGLPELLREVRPDVLSVSGKYMQAFLHETELASAVKEIGTKILTIRNPFLLEPYDKVRREILAGRRDGEYEPPFVFWALVLCEKLNIKTEQVKKFLLKFYDKEKGRKVLLERLEEEKKILNFADAHGSYIEKAYEIYASYGVSKEKIFILGNSPDTDVLFDIRKKIEQEPPILPYSPHRAIHVGRLVEWKRVDLLIRSIGALKKEFHDAELLVVGYGPEEQRLKSLAQELGLENAVRFLGGIYDQALLGKYLMSSAVYVLGGMGGISINDAMAFGRPIICSVCDGTEKKLVYDGRNGFYFKNGDGKDLTQKIRQIFTNPALAERMGTESTNIIKKDVNIHTLVDAYKQVFNYALLTKQ